MVADPPSNEINRLFVASDGTFLAGRLGYEVLQGNGGVALQTPLATLYTLDGPTDRFLVTPPDGLRVAGYHADAFGSDATRFRARLQFRPAPRTFREIGGILSGD